MISVKAIPLVAPHHNQRVSLQRTQRAKKQALSVSAGAKPNIKGRITMDERLSRMEDKLDRLSEAVVAMARMEERILTVFKRLEHIDASFKKFDERVQ